MSALREEIRAILREEIAALRGDMHAAPQRHTERVRVGTTGELNRFVTDLLRRAADPEFRARIERGEIVFELAEPAATVGAPLVTGSPRPAPERIEKTLVTERDIAALGGEVRSIRVAPHCRLTPLARDEARRRGIRIERTER